MRNKFKKPRDNPEEFFYILILIIGIALGMNLGALIF